MYSDPIVLAGIAAVVATALVAVGFFIFIMIDSTDNPGDESEETGQDNS